MAWIIRIDGFEVDSDDFLLDDLDWVERHTGSFWSILNPWKHASHARAFTRVALVRSGVPEADADERVAALTLRDIKGAFDFREDGEAAGDGSPGKDPTAPNSPSSSRGGRGSSSGRRKRPASSG